MINRKVKLAVTYFDWELLEENTSCSSLEMIASTTKLFKRIMSDDSLDFTVLFILPFSESLKWNKSFFYLYLLDFTSVRWSVPVNLPSCLTYILWRVAYFLCSISLTRLSSTLHLWPILFTLTWFLWYQKKFEKKRRVIDPCSYRHWPLFRHFSHSVLFHFCIFLKTQQ